MNKLSNFSQIYDSLLAAHQEKVKKLTPEIEKIQLQLSSKKLSQSEYHQLRDRLDVLTNQVKFLKPKSNFEALIDRVNQIKDEYLGNTQEHLKQVLDDSLAEKIAHFISTSPKGALSLTSLYDNKKMAHKLCVDFSRWSKEDLIALAQMPEFVSITGMLSWKGLGEGDAKSRKTLTLAEIKEFVAYVQELGLDMKKIATKRNKSGLPSYEDLKSYQQSLSD